MIAISLSRPIVENFRLMSTVASLAFTVCMMHRRCCWMFPHVFRHARVDEVHYALLWCLASMRRELTQPGPLRICELDCMSGVRNTASFTKAHHALGVLTLDLPTADVSPKVLHHVAFLTSRTSKRTSSARHARRNSASVILSDRKISLTRCWVTRSRLANSV